LRVNNTIKILISVIQLFDGYNLGKFITIFKSSVLIFSVCYFTFFLFGGDPFHFSSCLQLPWEICKRFTSSFTFSHPFFIIIDLSFARPCAFKFFPNANPPLEPVLMKKCVSAACNLKWQIWFLFRRCSLRSRKNEITWWWQCCKLCSTQIF